MKEGSFEEVSCGDRTFLLPIFVLIPAIPRFPYIVLSSEKRSAHNSWPGVKRHFVFFTLRSSPLSEGRILQKSIMMNDVTREIHEVRVKKKIIYSHTKHRRALMNPVIMKCSYINQDRISMWSVVFDGWKKTGKNPEKNTQSKDENQQQAQSNSIKCLGLIVILCKSARKLSNVQSERLH